MDAKTLAARARQPPESNGAAVALQRELAAHVRHDRDLDEPRTVAGVDIAVRGDRARAAVAVLSWPALEPLRLATAVRPLEFPYVPGLLAFRELPAILEAFDQLDEPPDLLFVDGHGVAHPRRFGVACHVGVATDRPTIGIGKSLLVGEHREPGARRGSRCRLVHNGELIGFALRTRDGVRPIYVNVGHRVDLDTAARFALRAATRYRLPEPIRRADAAAGQASRTHVVRLR